MIFSLVGRLTSSYGAYVVPELLARCGISGMGVLGADTGSGSIVVHRMAHSGTATERFLHTPL